MLNFFCRIEIMMIKNFITRENRESERKREYILFCYESSSQVDDRRHNR